MEYINFYPTTSEYETGFYSSSVALVGTDDADNSTYSSFLIDACNDVEASVPYDRIKVNIRNHELTKTVVEYYKLDAGRVYEIVNQLTEMIETLEFDRANGW